MAGFKGRNIIFRWDGTELLGVRERGIALTGAPVDVTSDEDDSWRTLLDNLATQNEITISIGGVIKSNVLRLDWFNNTRTRPFEIEYPDGSTISGTAYLSSYTDTGPYNDAATFQAELMSSGPVTYV